MKTPNPKIREHVVICLALCIAMAGYAILGILPLHGVLRNLQQKASAQSSTINRAQRAQSELERTTDRIEKLESRIGDFEKQVPAERQVGEFLQQIAELMKDHGLNEQAVRPGTEREGTRLNRIPVIMEGQGSLSEVFEFFKSLQQLERFVRIEKVELTSENYAESQVSMWADTSIFYKP